MLLTTRRISPLFIENLSNNDWKSYVHKLLFTRVNFFLQLKDRLYVFLLLCFVSIKDCHYLSQYPCCCFSEVLLSHCLYCSLFVKCVHVILVRNTCMNRLCVCVCARARAGEGGARGRRNTCMNMCVCMCMPASTHVLHVCVNIISSFFLNETRLQSFSGH